MGCDRHAVWACFCVYNERGHLRWFDNVLHRLSVMLVHKSEIIVRKGLKMVHDNPKIILKEDGSKIYNILDLYRNSKRYNITE